jgi:hypothetical protein
MITGPFYSILGVTKIQEGDTIIPAISLFGIEAHVNQDVSILNKEEFNYLKEILPTSEWSKYSCSWAIALAFNPQFSTDSYNTYKSRLLFTFLQLTSEHPLTTLNHISCATSYIWRISQANGGYYGSMDNSEGSEGSASWIKNYIYDHGYNPVDFVSTYPSSTFSQIHDIVSKNFRPFISNITQNVLARPAIYLYLMLFAIFIYSFRTSSVSMLLVAVPSLIQSAVIFGVAMTPELRYQYAVMLVGTLVFLPLLTLIPRPDITDPNQDNP